MVLRSLFSFVLLVGFSVAHAEKFHSGEHQVVGYLGQVQAHTPAELESILQRVDELLQEESGFSSDKPLALVLHGEEAQVFLRQNYGDFRSLVDQAARLEAFNAIDVQICETWLRSHALDKDDLPHFVDTVPYGPARKVELLEQGYEYF